MPQLKRPNSDPRPSSLPRTSPDSGNEQLIHFLETDTPPTYTAQQLIQALPAAIYTCDANGFILSYNKAAAALWGREPEIGKEAWCGSPIIYTMDGKALALDQCPMAIAIKEGREIQDTPIIIERPDGKRRIIMPHSKPFINTAGKVTGAVNMLVDITEQKTVEESNGHFAAIVESSDDAIISKTLDGIVTSWNNSAERIFGYTAQEMIGVSITKIVPPNRLDEEPAILKRLKRGERIDHFETKRITKDGRLLDISLSISPVKNSKGIIIGASKIARDITAQKRVEQQIKESEERLRLAIEGEQRKAKEELEKTVLARTNELLSTNSALEKSNHELEQFAYIASHDLQEPLRKIQTFADMVKDHLHDSQLTEKYFTRIYSSAKRMSTLINDVLNYSRLTKTGEQFQKTDLNKVLKDVLFDYELLIEQKQATVLHTDLPTLKGIPLQLHQLFANLISNSLKFSENKPVINITSTMLLEEEREYVKLVFSDNGIGFEQQYAEQIFIIFQRLNNMRTYSGTGIGLALCKKIVDHHDGIITAKSAPGMGATFTIILPVNH
ncbi:PAS domain S-box-containing protein [Niastella yeongjuensis]|nr:PAS domain S-box-containing protein [Niastella yeongjuensis]